MLLRAVVTWFVLMGLAIANGAFREAILTPRLGAAKGHIVSTVILCALIGVITWAVMPWINPPSASDALSVGAVWLALTLAFEFGFGHFVAHKPWSELFADYNLLAGRVWIFIPIVVLVAPYLAAEARGLL